MKWLLEEFISLFNKTEESKVTAEELFEAGLIERRG
jgi:hypothetical protein